MLGPLDVVDDGHPVALGGSRQRALLAFLLLCANEPVSADRLLDELWRDAPQPAAAKTLQVTVSRLRKALGTPGPIVTREHSYALRVDPEHVDAHRFERLAGDGARALGDGDPHRAASVLEDALGLWRGPPLADLAYEAFAQQEAARLEELRIGVHEQLVEAKLALGRHAEVVGALETLIAGNPYRERLRAQHMLALYRCDRQAEALQAFQDARSRLVDELGIEPGQRLRELEQAILEQDASLALTAVPEAGDAVPRAAAGPALPTGVVSFLLTDIEGSTALWDADAAAMEAALEEHDALVGRLAEEHGGQLLKAKGEGDSTFSVFPRATGAVAAAASLQVAVAAADWPVQLRVRAAVHTGEAHERAGDFFGPAVNRAARLRGLAGGGETVLSQATAELVRDRLPEGTQLADLGERALRGLARPERIFALRAALPPGGEAAARRKTVTVLFAGLAREAAPRDPEVRRRETASALEAMQAVLERHGASVEAHPADVLMAVFGVPLLHEDDASRAVRAAVEAAGLLAERGATARAGIATGEVLAERAPDGQTLTSGEAVSAARRLEALAEPGEVLVDDRTHRLVRDAVAAERVAGGIRVTALRRDLPGRIARRDAPLVGRDRQLATIAAACADAVADRSCHLVTVLGSAGVGKSRLVAESLGALDGEPLVLHGRCLPYGEGITYWPVTEVVRELVGEDEPVTALTAALGDEPQAAQIAAGVADAFGAAAGGSGEQIAWAVRRLFETLARRRPLVVVLDDLHWAEPTLLDLVDHVADLARDAPLVLLCMARPELLDGRPAWGGGRHHATTVLLEPLPAEVTTALAATLLERARLDPASAPRIAATSEGNPLFAEELVAMLADGEDELETPPTITALLAARLEQLPDDERAVLTRVAVEGTEFHRDAALALAPEPLAADVDRCLTALVRRDLIRPHRSAFTGADGFRFRHMLIRDAAYGSLPKATRARLHARFADWLEDVAGERAAELGEILGYHLERASRLLDELGEPDADLGAHAAERLCDAGRRAVARGDPTAAIGLFDRAVALLPHDDVHRATALPLLGATLLEAGELARAGAVLADASATAAAAGDEVSAAHADVHRAHLRLQRSEDGARADAEAVVERVLPVFARAGDELGLATAWRLRGWATWCLALADPAAVAYTQAAEHAVRAGAEHERIEGLALAAAALFYGPTPVDEAIARCEAIRGEMGGSLEAGAAAAESLAGLYGLRGDFDDARALVRRRDDILSELGLGLHTAACHPAAVIELLAGEPAAAEARMRQAYEALEQMGETALLSTTAAIVGQAIVEQGRDEEAAEWAAAAAGCTADDDVITHVIWRGVRARSLAARGISLDEAESLAREAVELALRTDFVFDQGEALRDLGLVLRAAGREDAAREAFASAVERFERKGVVPSLARVRALLADPSRV